MSSSKFSSTSNKANKPTFTSGRNITRRIDNGPTIPLSRYLITLHHKIPQVQIKPKKRVRFNDMAEKREAIKSKPSDLRHENEKIKETAEGNITERDMLKEKLLNTQKDLQLILREYERIKLRYEILKRENEKLHNKTRLLDGLTYINRLKRKTSDYDKLKMEFDDLTRRHKNLSEEVEAFLNSVCICNALRLIISKNKLNSTLLSQEL